jgi:site-specific recombinase XerD
MESLVARSANSLAPLNQNPAAVYLSSLSENSRLTMRTALNTLGELLGIDEALDANGQDVRFLSVSWAALRHEDTTALRAALEERYAPATANKLLTALRRVLKEARRLGQISADDYVWATDIHTISGKSLPRGRVLVEAEIAALMRMCADDLTPAGARDAALLALLRGTGMRRSEVVILDLANYDAVMGALTICDGKGCNERVIYLPVGARKVLDEWIGVRGDSAGPLFYGLVRGGGLVVRRLAAQAVAIVCATRAAEAGVTPFTPHDMRCTFISGLLDAGVDIATVQRLAGHKNAATTSRYDRRGEMANQQAVDLVHIPYYPRQVNVS